MQKNMSIYKGTKLNLESAILYLIGLTSTWYIVQIQGDPVCVWLVLLYLIVSVLKHKKLAFRLKSCNSSYLLFFVCIVLSAVSQLRVTGLSITRMILQGMLLALFAMYSCNIRDNDIRRFICGLRLSCKIQVLWCLIQYVTDLVFSVNINDLIFNNILNMSVAVDTNFVVTGLCWHPTNLVVVILLLLLMYPQIYTWVICALIAAVTRSSTIVICMLTVFVLKFVHYAIRWIKAKQIKIHVKKNFIIALLIGFYLIAVFVFSNAGNMFLNSLSHLFERLQDTPTATDGSNFLHMRYYTAYFYIASQTEVFTNLFGYGYRYSGYPFTHYFGQYAYLENWSVESEPMKLLYGTGIVGAVVYYTWMIRPMLKARTLDYNYLILFSTIIFCGIFYDNQFSWVVIVEILIIECIERKINIFRKEID